MSFEKNIKYVNINNYNIDINHNKRLFNCLESLVNDFEILNITDYVITGSTALVLYYKKFYRTINDIDIYLSTGALEKIKNLNNDHNFLKKYIIKKYFYSKIFDIKIHIFRMKENQKNIFTSYNYLLFNSVNLKCSKPEGVLLFKKMLKASNQKHKDDIDFFKNY